MLWEQKVEKVVMLVSEHHEKLEKYWRDDGDIVFGDVRVRLASSQVFADFTVRRLELNKREKPLHTVLQYHYTAWPDKEVPPSLWSLVDFQQRVTSYPSCRPTLVHCGGGVANTGTFIALELILHDIKSTGYMDFFNTIWRLRQDRMHMVHTAEQYIFLHKVVQVAVLCAGTNVQTEDVQDRTSRLDMRTFSGLTYAEKEFTAVCNCIIDGSNYLKGNRKSRVSRYLHQLVDETSLHGRSYTQAPGNQFTRQVLHSR
ncbi:receptor-type tyrosine-protein phosphatase alpha-like [Physella acuta]|uniref:receptor-type tyrosine-protein phosphatase alpha-like n=1 Tax=Physella acuta TaxID=109671 RepID=UPI0027DD558C|nr:receptor-type tyrosine-protein phosphatase alpha-like [Physella acuta]